MENLGTIEDEFWARGITEDLIIKVSGAGLLRVASINEVLKFTKNDDNKTISEILNVQYLLFLTINDHIEGTLSLNISFNCLRLNKYYNSVF